MEMSAPWRYTLCGVWVVLVHIAAGLFALGVAVVHTTVWDGPMLSYTVTQVESDIFKYFGATIAVAYAILAGHVLLIVRILFGTSIFDRAIRRWQQRRATVAPLNQFSLVTLEASLLERTMASLEIFSRWSVHRRKFDQLWSHLALWWTKYAPEITRLRMVCEVALQVYQANKTSQFVANRVINRLMAMVIVLNCWFSPVVHYAMRGRPSVVIRLVRLVLDACLDIVYSIVIPMAIFQPYYRAYECESSPFPTVNYYMDTWYTNALSELRQVFVISWMDWIAKTIGSVALLYRLYVVQATLTTARATLARPKQSRRSTSPEIRLRPMSWLCRILDTVLLGAGLTVLALHIQSSGFGRSLYSESKGCLLEMHPWGAMGYTCACLEISCSQHGTLGDRDRMQSILERVNSQTVQVLIFSNCPALCIPPAIQRLENVMMIKIYNSTLVSWDQDAALRQRYHPSLQVLYVARVNMSTLPVGLLAHDFPPSLWDIEFCITNLTTTLPESTTQAWRNVIFVLLEGHSAVTKIPDVLLQLPYVDSLMVGANGIRSVPDHSLENLSLVQLSLDHNPLQELPASVGSFQKLYVLGVRGTNVSAIPQAWLAANGALNPDHHITVLAADTPLCADLLANGTAITVDGTLVYQVDWFRIDCFRLATPSDRYVYPIADEDNWRRKNK